MGATDPLKAEEGTLRKMYGLSIDKNSVHGSDSAESAKTEIDFFLINKRFISFS
jgi:nucleoside-diphosphate kinase